MDGRGISTLLYPKTRQAIVFVSEGEPERKRWINEIWRNMEKRKQKVGTFYKNDKKSK